MDIKSMEFKQRIYDLLIGEFNLEEYPVPEGQFIKNEFSEGSFCSKAYEDAFQAYSHLCERLNVSDMNDQDVEKIFHSLLSITSHLCMKMYDYGIFFSQYEKGGPIDPYQQDNNKT